MEDKLENSKANTGEEISEAKSHSEGFFRGFSVSPSFGYTVSGLVAIFVLTTIGWLIFSTSNEHANSMVELRKLCETERPIEARIEGFKFAKYTASGREKGKTVGRAQKLQLIENSLAQQVSTSPDEKSHEALGTLHLIRREFDKALSQYDKSEAVSGRKSRASGNRAIAYLGKAGQSSGVEADQHLEKALVEINSAIDGDDRRHATLFNKALILEKLDRKLETASAWREYLERDSVTEWAEEARRHLTNLK